MPGIFNTLNIARRALQASQLGIDIASHNIANANTPGYSRQRVNLSSALPVDVLYGAVGPIGALGTGVKADSIIRIRNGLLDSQFRQANHTFGKNNIKEQMLYQVETVLQEPTENGIGNLMTEFFTEFSNLGSEPENTNIRNVVVQKATSLALSFNQKSARLRELQKSLRQDTDNALRQVNQFSSQIAELNRQVSAAEGGFANANDLRDQRDLLLDKLAEFVQIQYSEDSSGQVTVAISGQTLVIGANARELTVTSAGSGNNLEISIQGSDAQALNIQTGKIGGLIDTHNNQIGNLLNRLDTLAGKFVEEVNRVHQFGKGLPVGSPPTSATGLDFFVGSDASSIQVASQIKDNVANLAASNDGATGNGEVAFTIANLRNQKLLNNNTETFNTYYNNTITLLGTEIQSASSTRRNQEMVLDQIDNQRVAESGVSLDEEMTQLIQFQRSLEAAARIVTTVDEMLQTVINM